MSASDHAGHARPWGRMRAATSHGEVGGNARASSLEWLASVGEGMVMRAPFHYDDGGSICIGQGTFLDFNGVHVDARDLTAPKTFVEGFGTSRCRVIEGHTGHACHENGARGTSPPSVCPGRATLHRQGVTTWPRAANRDVGAPPARQDGISAIGHGGWPRTQEFRHCTAMPGKAGGRHFLRRRSEAVTH
ncbi:hypothetical protein ACPPVV_10375 [Rhodanobacter sp. Col0626]|uniref:hypothetical protein n=1 Tax=Rhodanobacter sp. Col0626 TaxID=3415679 RepID=UPI003CFA6B60